MKKHIYISVKLPAYKVVALKELYDWALEKWSSGKKDHFLNLLGAHIEDMKHELAQVLAQDPKQVKLQLRKSDAAAFALTWGQVVPPGMEGGVIVADEIIQEIHKKAVFEKQLNS